MAVPLTSSPDRFPAYFLDYNTLTNLSLVDLAVGHFKNY